MPYRLATPHCGVNGGNRTLDLQSHNLALYRLSYIHHAGASGRIRTCDLCLRRALLYPAELQTLMERVKGIGPSQPAWKAGALPLSYTRKHISVTNVIISHSRYYVKKKHKNFANVLQTLSILTHFIIYDKIPKR